MADLVFLYEDKSPEPNIHGLATHYEGGLITLQFLGNHFDNIKSRYLDVMKALLARLQGNAASKSYVEALDTALFLNLLARLENELVSHYNSTIIPTLSSTYLSAARAIGSGVLRGDKQAVVAALNLIISIFKNSDPRLLGLIYEANANNLDTIPTDLQDILGIGAILTAVDKVASGNVTYNSLGINSILTPSSEALSALSATIDTLANDVSGEAILAAIKKQMTGTTRAMVRIDLNNPNSKLVENKVTDITLPLVSYRETIKRNGNEVENNVVLTVDPYISVKTYRSRRTNIVKMVSYAGGNSIAMTVLRDIYGDTPETNYLLYNTIAFSGRGNPDLALNFKIIRSDMVALLAEKYLIGYNDDTSMASLIMVHNFKAYSVLAILAAIAQLAREATEKGGTYSGTGDIFSIRFDNMYKIKNTWHGTEKSNADKYYRIILVKNAIDNISTRGYLNMNLFNKFVASHTLDGIPLDGIIPRVPLSKFLS